MKKLLLSLLVFTFSISSTVGSTGAYLSDEETSHGNVFTAGCWAAPTAPSLVYPANGYVANITSEWIANPYMDWTDSTGCPGATITYQYESYHDAGLTSLAYRSGPLSISQIPAPGTPDGKYYWRVRSFDGTTYSGWSDVWLLTVDRSQPNNPPEPGPEGSVVINEVMWMGTSVSGGDDEWVELRNTTSSPIDLTDWELNIGTSGDDLLLEGTIPAHGFYLITERPTDDSAINDSITPDLVTEHPISLPDGGRQLILKNSSGDVTDETPTGAWPAGYHHSPGTIRKSMERNDIPGDGTVGTNWHTCTDDGCNSSTFWDISEEGMNYGTPKAANLSAGDPTEVNLDFYKSDYTHLGFKLSGDGLPGYENAQYLITYDSDQTTQGISGHFDISGRTEIITSNLFMGTCSTGGTCTANTGIKNIKITVTLTGASQKILSSTIN